MGILRDLKSNLDAVQSLLPAARAVTANGTGVDLLDFGGAMAVADIGLWTDGTYTLKLQESDDNAAWADVAAGDLIGAFTVIDDAADDNVIQRVGYRGIKRYIRAVVTESASPAPSTGVVLGVLIVRGLPNLAPTP